MNAEFGLALENFTPENKSPSIESLIEYGEGERHR